MTSTFAPSQAADTTAATSAWATGAARDLRPGSRAPRPRSRFPRPQAPQRPEDGSVQERGTCALWVGPAGPLRELAHDHATAVGLELVDAGSTNVSTVAVVLAQAEPPLADDLPTIPEAALLMLTDAPTISQEQWRSALENGARAVLRLPAESDSLLTHLARAARPRRRSLLLGVVGGCGGAGASSLAARLAAAATRHGNALLVDADPLGGGLDLLVEAPQHPDVGWQDVATVGSTDGEALRQALPVVDEVRLLVAGDGPGPDPSGLEHALHALEPAGGTVVVDLSPALVPVAAAHLDRLLIVVPATDHAVRAAARRLRQWALPHGLSSVAVRRRGPLSPSEVATDLRLPLAMSFRDSAPGAVPLLDVRRGGADRACRSFLTALLAAGGNGSTGGLRS